METLITETVPSTQKPHSTQAVESDWRAKVPSVSQLTRQIRGHIENTFFDVWVRGEISNFRKPVSGHAYFILKDATSQLRGVMFRGQLAKLKFALQDGMEILLHGVVSVYEARGEYQLVCDTAEPVGVGALQKAFEQLKTKLHAEGLFDPKYKKALPFLPRRIGVVTSATGAAIRDILKVISCRFPNLEVLVIPASVQGDAAASEIVTGIKAAEKWNELYPDKTIEALIVGRGGGSMEDMWPFNEEIVARAIFACTIPIISAVGHEIDFTIADFVADLRAPTPSAAAEMVVPKKDELLFRIQSQSQRIHQAMTKRLQQMRLHIGHLGQRLVDPRERLKVLKSKFMTGLEKLTSIMRHRILFCKKNLQSHAQLLHSLSPLQVIARGYSLTRTEDGKIVRSVSHVAKNDSLRITVTDGVIDAVVSK